jgi:hypothetical protein
VTMSHKEEDEKRMDAKMMGRKNGKRDEWAY